METSHPLKRCVIADDVRSSRELLSSWLTTNGFNCVTVADGNEAWDEIQNHPPDLVITDILMSNCCGLKLLKRIRQSELETINAIPVLVITCLGDCKLTQTIQRFGGNALLAKPLEKQSTLRSVVGVLASGAKTNNFIVNDPDNKNAGNGLISPTFRRHMQDENSW